MRIESLKIKEGLYECVYEFRSAFNLVFSLKNSVGKTSLLRLLMYSLGYAIPSTRGLNFQKFELYTEITDDQGKTVLLYRNQDYMTVTLEGKETGYSLPNDLHTIHSIIFGIKNDNILDNLLGAFYIDQEKGWTLLNRGKAIGNNQFTIENLVLGLSDRACDDLEERLSTVKRELKKYKQMFDTAQYQTQLNELGENLVFDSENEELQKKIDVLQFDRKPLYEELKRLEDVIKKNSSFKKYIGAMKLFVKAPNGATIPVNEQTLVGFSENMEYITTKRKLVSTELAELDRKIQSIERQLQKEGTLYDVKTMIESFDADISKVHIDARAVDKILKNLEKERKRLENLITESTKSNNPVVTELHNLISGYATELGISEEYVRPNKDYIFTSDLKSLSGAIFHKMVFAFKLAYIQSVFHHTGTRLPIILDSPSGREVDQINVDDMMKILVRDFSAHQIIIASIFKYDLPDLNVIELKNRLLDF